MNPDTAIIPGSAAWARGEDMAPGARVESRRRGRPSPSSPSLGHLSPSSTGRGRADGQRAPFVRFVQVQDGPAVDGAMRRLEHVEGMIGRDEAKLLGVLLDAWKNKIDLVTVEEVRRALGWDAMQGKYLRKEIGGLVLNLRRFLVSTGTGAWVECVREKPRNGNAVGWRMVVERVEGVK